MRNEIAFAWRGGEGINVESSGDRAGGGEGVGEGGYKTISCHKKLVCKLVEADIDGFADFLGRKQINIGIERKLIVDE